MTTDFLRSIPSPEAVEEVSYQTVLDEIIGGLRTELPDWAASPNDPLYAAAERLALREVERAQYINSQFRQNFIPTAGGTNLDNLAALVGITRNDGESDDDFRARIPHVIASQAIGTPQAFRTFAIEANAAIADVSVSASSTNTGIDYTVYAAKDAGVALSSTERTALQTYLDHDDRKPLGTDVTVSATTETAYTITVALTYDSREYTLGALQDAARASLYGYIDEHLGIGQGIYVNGVLAAASVEGVLSVAVSSPSADLAPTAGRIYKAAKTTAGVTFGAATDVAP